MAADVNDEIFNAINLIVITKVQSCNTKKGLKYTTYETLSILKNVFVKVKFILDSKTAEITKLDKQVNNESTPGGVLKQQS